MNFLDTLKSSAATVGYNLGLPGLGVTQPIGTPYNSNQTPYKVYNQTQAYSQPYSYTNYSVPQQTSWYNYGGQANKPSTLGAATSNTTSNLNTINNSQSQQQKAPDPQQQAINNYRSQQEGQINDRYNQYHSYLDQQIGALPQYQQTLEDQIGSQYGGQLSTVQSGQQQAQTDLNTSATKAQQNQASTFKDLEENMRNSLFAANQVLGQKGASDSSAANMYSYALTKASNKQRAGVQNATNQTLGDIEARREKVNTVAQDQINQLNTWKSNQLLQVNQYIQDKKNELSQMVANGQMDRSTALQQLNAEVFAPSLQRLQQIDSDMQNWKNQIVQWGMSRAQEIDAYKAQQGQLATVDTPQYVAQQLQYLPQYAQAAENAAPFLFGNVRKDQYLQS